MKKSFKAGEYDVKVGRGGVKSRAQREAFAALESVVNEQPYSRLPPKQR